MFAGALTALVTPFLDDRIDEKALRALLQLKKQFGGTIWVLNH